MEKGNYEKQLETLTRFTANFRQIKINNLFYLFNWENLGQCFSVIKKSKTPGSDGITIEDYEKNLKKNLTILAQQVKDGTYRPEPLQRFYKKKKNGEKRPLSIVSVKDTIVHTGVKRILESIYEPEFLDFSFGFRTGRNCSQALEYIEQVFMKNPVNFILDADIKGFFDNVTHRILIKCLEQRISDRKFLHLIQIILKPGYVEEGKYFPTGQGVPQGAVCSPVMANIFLHYLVDLWMQRIVKPNMKGYVEMVRYADDFLIFIEINKEAERILKALQSNLQQFGLELSREKTRLIPFGKNTIEKHGVTFDFLGVTHFNDGAVDGSYRVGRWAENNTK